MLLMRFRSDMVDKTLLGGYNGAITRRRVAMPKYISLDWKGYSISTRPVGWRRLFHYPKNIWEFPYFAGDSVKLKLGIKTNHVETLPFILQIYEFFPEYKTEAYIYNEKKIYECLIDDIELDKPRSIQIISKDNIAQTGDGFYSILVSMKQPSDQTKAYPQIIGVDTLGHKIMTFNAYRSEKVAFGVYAILWGVFVFLMAWFLKG